MTTRSCATPKHVPDALRILGSCLAVMGAFSASRTREYEPADIKTQIRIFGDALMVDSATVDWGGDTATKVLGGQLGSADAIRAEYRSRLEKRLPLTNNTSWISTTSRAYTCSCSRAWEQAQWSSPSA